MTFKNYIDLSLKEARLANIKEVRADIQKTWVQEKIDNHIEKFNGLFSSEEICSMIMSNDIVASFFAKDPLKQNLAEKACANWIGVPKLPASGKNCVRFDNNGNIVSTKTPTASKSADFMKDGVYYTQKYTGNNTGGAQDNQFDDVVLFLINGLLITR